MTGLFDLSGRSALVTGAASGIGARVALGLAEAGADVSCVDLAASHDGAACHVTGADLLADGGFSGW